MRTLTITVAFLALAACDKGGAEPTHAPEAAATAPAEDDGGEAAAVVATEPDNDKLVLHIREHLELPADKAKILEACANTPEFSEGEKQWVAEHLPEGNYESPDDVIAAMGLAAE